MRLNRIGFARDNDGRRSRDLGILPFERSEPAEFTGLCRVRVRLIEPRRPVLDDPIALGVGGRVAGADDSCSLGWVSGSVPADQEPELTFGKVADFIEALQVMRATLVLLLVAYELNGAELNSAVLPAVSEPP